MGGFLMRDAIAALNGQALPDDGRAADQNPAADPQQRHLSAFYNLLTGWLRASHAVAALSPQAIRDHIGKAQNGFAGMIDGALERNPPRALAGKQQFATESTNAIVMNDARLSEYARVFAGEGDIMDKMGRIADVAAKWQDFQIAEMAREPQHFSTFGRLYDALSAQQKAFKQTTGLLDAVIRRIESQIDLGGGGDGVAA